jgi:hypothetical protein
MTNRVAVVVVAVIVGLAAVLTGEAVRNQAVAEASGAAHTVATALAAGPGPVPAFWTAPDGGVRRGQIDAPAGTDTGRTVDLWVDGTGAPVAPRGLAEAGVEGLLAGLLVLVGGWLPLAACVLVRRRGALDREWAAVAPRWTTTP